MPNETCRYCGCTEGKPVEMVPDPHAPTAGQPVIECEWADTSKTTMAVSESSLLKGSVPLH